MSSVGEMIALPLAFIVSIGLLLLFDYGFVYALVAAIDFFRGLAG